MDKQSKTIEIDKEFLDQVLQSITDLKERMDKYEQAVKTENKEGFVINCNTTYIGDKDLVREKQFTDELQQLMIRFKIISVKADLAKRF